MFTDVINTYYSSGSRNLALASSRSAMNKLMVILNISYSNAHTNGNINKFKCTPYHFTCLYILDWQHNIVERATISNQSLPITHGQFTQL